MSIPWNSYGTCGFQNLINIRNQHSVISSEFCKNYYGTWDNNFPMIRNLYSEESMISFLGNEFHSFDQVFDWVKSQGIFRFSHLNITGTSQIINNNSILINVTGTINIQGYYGSFNHYFVETLIIRNGCNRWHITNSLFRLVD